MKKPRGRPQKGRGKKKAIFTRPRQKLLKASKGGAHTHRSKFLFYQLQDVSKYLDLPTYNLVELVVIVSFIEINKNILLSNNFFQQKIKRKFNRINRKFNRINRKMSHFHFRGHDQIIVKLRMMMMLMLMCSQVNLIFFFGIFKFFYIIYIFFLVTIRVLRWKTS